jgi:hypothetical protein
MYESVRGMMGFCIGVHGYAEVQLACVKIVSVETFTYKSATAIDK